MPAEVGELLDPEIQLAELVARHRNDPLTYAQIAFPWGEKGTSFEHRLGPCSCQKKILGILGEELRKRPFDGHTPCKPIKIAVASGHGIGKSFCCGCIDNFIRSTRPYCRGTVTATTSKQVHTKTWAAISEANSLSITGHWFTLTTERCYRNGEKDKWFSQPQTCEETNSEAFAGQHAANSTSYYINDEASGVPNKIFEVQIGGLMTGQPIQILFGNLTQNSGFFAEVMAGKHGIVDRSKPLDETRGWIIIRIDSRECELTNKEEIAEVVEAYGEDSDIVRVRVRGLPPKVGGGAYFPEYLIDASRHARSSGTFADALVAAADFAWGGEDENSVAFRHGLDGFTIPRIMVPGDQTDKPERMAEVLSDVLSREWLCGDGVKRKVAMLFGDGSGICFQVFAILRARGFGGVIAAVDWAGHPLDPSQDRNMKAQMMRLTKEWMQNGGGLPDVEELPEEMRDIIAVNYMPLQFEDKKLMKKRRKAAGIKPSTDWLDSFIGTFAAAVVLPEVQREAAGWKKQPRRPPVDSGWMG